MTLTRLSAP
jgi:hypothetical protein